MSEGEYETLTLCGGAVHSKDSESEDELLLTTASSKRLEQESQQSHSKQKKSAYCSFHIKHPQAHTHEVCLLDETEGFVPNFIGGSLPRKDAGSREEYCMTMLTLFKPWRTGKDLRLHENITWDDTFADYSFTERQKEIMKFFHIRYECNDARDDFSSQRRQAEKGGCQFCSVSMSALWRSGCDALPRTPRSNMRRNAICTDTS